jgi:threonyl-tRNA synthetase
MQSLIKSKQPFELKHASFDQARRLFSYNKHKLAIIDKLEKTESFISLYKCG